MFLSMIRLSKIQRVSRAMKAKAAQYHMELPVKPTGKILIQTRCPAEEIIALRDAHVDIPKLIRDTIHRAYLQTVTKK